MFLHVGSGTNESTMSDFSTRIKASTFWAILVSCGKSSLKTLRQASTVEKAYLVCASSFTGPPRQKKELHGFKKQFVTPARLGDRGIPGHVLGKRSQTESECSKTETEIGTPARVEAETWKFARQRGSSRALGTRGLYVLWNCYAANSHAATPALPKSPPPQCPGGPRRWWLWSLDWILTGIHRAECSTNVQAHKECRQCLADCFGYCFCKNVSPWSPHIAFHLVVWAVDHIEVCQPDKIFPCYVVSWTFPSRHWHHAFLFFVSNCNIVSAFQKWRGWQNVRYRRWSFSGKTRAVRHTCKEICGTLERKLRSTSTHPQSVAR